MQIIHFIYLLFVLVIFIYLLKNLNNSGFVLLILLWLYLYPILGNPEFMLSVNFFGFDLQPNRLLFLILSGMLIFSIINTTHNHDPDTKHRSTKINPFEWWLIIFFVIAIFSQIINIDLVGSRKTIANITNMVAFIVVYISAKKYMTAESFVVLLKGLIIFAVISSFIGIFQFFVDDQFFRIGSYRGGITGFVRSNGLFDSEYEQGMFLAMALPIGIGIFANRNIKILYAGILALGVFVTLHRMSAIAFILALMITWFLTIKDDIGKIAVSMLLITIVLLGLVLISWTNITSQGFLDTLINDRLLVDNTTIRMVLNEFALKLIIKYPLGIGDYFTEVYDKEAIANQIVMLDYGALRIHNGYLAAGVKYGVLGLLAFSIFLFSTALFFIRRKVALDWRWYVPVISTMVILLFNLTQDFSFLGNQVLIIWAILLGSFISIMNKGEKVNLVPMNQVFQY